MSAVHVRLSALTPRARARSNASWARAGSPARAHAVMTAVHVRREGVRRTLGSRIDRARRKHASTGVSSVSASSSAVKAAVSAVSVSSPANTDIPPPPPSRPSSAVVVRASTGRRPRDRGVPPDQRVERRLVRSNARASHRRQHEPLSASRLADARQRGRDEVERDELHAVAPLVPVARRLAMPGGPARSRLRLRLLRARRRRRRRRRVMRGRRGDGVFEQRRRRVRLPRVAVRLDQRRPRALRRLERDAMPRRRRRRRGREPLVPQRDRARGVARAFERLERALEIFRPRGGARKRQPVDGVDRELGEAARGGDVQRRADRGRGDLDVHRRRRRRDRGFEDVFHPADAVRRPSRGGRRARRRLLPALASRALRLRLRRARGVRDRRLRGPERRHAPAVLRARAAQGFKQRAVVRRIPRRVDAVRPRERVHRQRVRVHPARAQRVHELRVRGRDGFPLRGGFARGRGVFLPSHGGRGGGLAVVLLKGVRSGVERRR
eukprot:5105-Pelagococcus_subviridis.AAC.1